MNCNKTGCENPEDTEIFRQDIIIRTVDGKFFVHQGGLWYTYTGSGRYHNGVKAYGCLGLCGDSKILQGKGDGRITCSNETCNSGVEVSGFEYYYRRFRNNISRLI